MKTYDWTKARTVVHGYLEALETQHPLRLGRTWIEASMAKAGLIEDSRFTEFGESHAAWYACIIKCRAIGRVTDAESAKQTHKSKTATTIRKIRNGSLRSSPTAALLEKMLNSDGKRVTRSVP